MKYIVQNIASLSKKCDVLSDVWGFKMDPIMDTIWIQYGPTMDPIISKNIVNMHSLHDVLQEKYWKIQGVSKKLSLVDMLDVMDVMAKWKVVGVWKKLYLIFIYKYKNTICSNTQTHSNTPTNTVWIWGKMKKIQIFENLFQIESLGSGFSQTIKRPKRQ